MTLSNEQLGIACFKKGDFGKAVVHFSKALKEDPKNPDLFFNFGSSLQCLGEHKTAIAAFRASLQGNPHNAAAHNNAGLSSLALGRYSEATTGFQQALALNPKLFEAYGNLGNALLTLGRIEEAQAIFRRAISLRPTSADAHRCYLLSQFYVPDFDLRALFEQQRDYENLHARPLYKTIRPHKNRPDPARRLRIGYLSSDFRDHPVGHNLAPLAFNHDKEKIETYFYAEVSTNDQMTDRFKATADHWRPTVGLDDRELAKLVRRDGIDILLFLACHMDSNRSLVASRKPAPIQISYHDIATSGLEVMDYWLTDAFLHPENTAEPFTEALYRLPNFYVYPPIDDAPEIAPLPCATTGQITFGSFNNPAKMNPKVIALWSRVLRAVPNSRLLLKYSGVFDNPEALSYFQRQFAQNGISADRIDFHAGKESRKTHLSRYGQIDIALDTFPFNGATTTFEALWNGVPVITFTGERFIGRAAASILKIIGLNDFIARDQDDFVRIAGEISNDRPRLQAVRSSLRERMKASPLLDGPAYARSVEAAYREMWRDWCAAGQEG